MGIKNSKQLNFDFDDKVDKKPNRLKDLWKTIWSKKEISMN
jgi:hypothetical protein